MKVTMNFPAWACALCGATENVYEWELIDLPRKVWICMGHGRLIGCKEDLIRLVVKRRDILAERMGLWIEILQLTSFAKGLDVEKASAFADQEWKKMLEDEGWQKWTRKPRRRPGVPGSGRSKGSNRSRTRNCASA